MSDNTSQSRVTLPPNLPPRTKELARFEEALVRLNRFYWTYVCSLDVADKAASGASRVQDFVPSDNWRQLDISAAEFLGLRSELEAIARQTFLVHAIVYFEEYLASALRAYLIKTLKQTKMYSVKLRLGDLPSANTAEYVRVAAIDAEIADIIGAKYSERANRIRALLKEHGTSQNIDVTMPDDALLVAANEVRNCIIHNAGVADSRAVSALGVVFPGLRIGDLLPLDFSALKKLLGAIRDGARAVDVAIRLRSEDGS